MSITFEGYAQHTWFLKREILSPRKTFIVDEDLGAIMRWSIHLKKYVRFCAYVPGQNVDLTIGLAEQRMNLS